MTFGRSDAEFWRMTPAKLHALSDVHVEAHTEQNTTGPTRKPSADPRADLAALGADFT